MNPLQKQLYVIADAGSNWNRFDNEEDNLRCALLHVSRAAQCGVSAIKFQLFTHRELYGIEGPSPYALPHHFLPLLATAAAKSQIDFMCTAFSPEGIAVVDPFVKVHKLASSEFTHTQMLAALIATEKPFIISTGAAEHQEILELIGTIPIKSELAIMECAAAYPAQECDYSLSLLSALSRTFPAITLGLSDHTLSDIVAIAAVGAGATVFEKHFDALYDSGGTATPDTPVSIGPAALREYCDSLRLASCALGTKTARQGEIDMLTKHRRRLKVIAPIKAGETLQAGINFGIYRSLTEDLLALPPAHLESIDGQKAVRDMRVGDGVTIRDLYQR